jgi:hypothetical protein
MPKVQSSGQISFSDLKSVFGGPAGTAIPLSNYYSGGSYVAANTRINDTIGTYVPTSGQISLTSFYSANTTQGDGWKYALYRLNIDRRFHTLTKLLKDSSGFLYLIGTTNIMFGDSFIITKINPSDYSIVWSRTFGNDSGEECYDACIDSADNIILVGRFEAGGSYTVVGQDIQDSALIVKYNSSGVLQWSRRFGGMWDDEFRSVTTDGTNSIYVGGRSQSIEGSTTSTGFSGAQSIIVKYNSSGTLQWQRSLTLSSGTGEIIEGICFSTGSGLLYTYLDGFNFSGTLLSQYNSSGVLQWQKRIAGFQSMFASRIIPNSVGGVYLLAYASFEAAGAGSRDILLFNIDSSGNVIWARFVGGTGSDTPSEINLDSSSNIYITGQTTSQPYGTYDGMVIKYNSSGVLQWVTAGGTAQTSTLGTYESFYSAEVVNDYIYVGAQMVQFPNTASANIAYGIHKFDPSLTLTSIRPPTAGSLLYDGQSLFRKSFQDANAVSSYTVTNGAFTDYARTLQINSVSATERAAPNAATISTGSIF